jgi:hypothetical protein
MRATWQRIVERRNERWDAYQREVMSRPPAPPSEIVQAVESLLSVVSFLMLTILFIGFIKLVWSIL